MAVNAHNLLICIKKSTKTVKNTLPTIDTDAILQYLCIVKRKG